MSKLENSMYYLMFDVSWRHDMMGIIMYAN